MYKKSNIIELYCVKKFSILNVSVLLDLFSSFFFCFPNTVHVIVLWRSLSYSRAMHILDYKGVKIALDLYIGKVPLLKTLLIVKLSSFRAPSAFWVTWSEQYHLGQDTIIIIIIMIIIFSIAQIYIYI